MTTLLAQWLVSGMAVALAATAAVRFVPAGAAAERHRLWWAALLAVVALPLFPMAASLVFPPVATPGVDGGTAAARDAALFAVALPSWLDLWLAVAWALWSSVSLARLGLSAVAVRRLVAKSTPLPSDALVRLLVGIRGAEVRSAPGLHGACAVGFVRPRIIVGAEVTTRCDADALRLIVLHEAAHLARYDDWIRLTRHLIAVAAGFHPAV